VYEHNPEMASLISDKFPEGEAEVTRKMVRVGLRVRVAVRVAAPVRVRVRGRVGVGVGVGVRVRVRVRSSPTARPRCRAVHLVCDFAHVHLVF